MSALVEISNLVKTFPAGGRFFGPRRTLIAVDGVNLSVARGETLGLVGESGCGKTTLGRCLVRLIEPDSGAIRFDGNDLLALSSRQLFPFRRRVQIVFQDPYTSLNPRRTVGSHLEEPLRLHNLRRTDTDCRARVAELLSLVGLPDDAATRYPHEFSGGQRQRVGIARALAVEPEFVVCDEPVSALDVSIQAQIVNLLKDLQERLGLSYLFISHDLRVVRHLCQRVAVMYLGKIVEEGRADTIFSSPKHPYTQALLSAVPKVGGGERRRIVLRGDPPRGTEAPPGCRFHPRCFAAEARCSREVPELREVAGRNVSCLLAK